MDIKVFEETLEEIKSSNIHGCITGSSLLPESGKETWEEVPDIDVFCGNDRFFTDAINTIRYKYGYKFGDASNSKTAAQEEWKFHETMRTGIWKKGDIGLSTVKLNKDDITINVTTHTRQSRALDVISNFDMALICRAYDIERGHYMDYSKVYKQEFLECFADRFNISYTQEDIDDPMFTTPNPHKVGECNMFTAQRWIRQWNRVLKYWDRGYNTITVAKMYSAIIQEVLDQGNIFNSERSIEIWEENTQDFVEVKSQIDKWIEVKEQCLN